MMATNDNSNPQQGNPFLQQQKMQQQKMQQMQTMQQQPVTSHTRRVFNVPPSKKDERKLFVGGLPSNSKYISMGVCVYVQCGVFV